MNWDSWIPLLTLFSSLAPGLLIFFLAEERTRVRTTLNLAGAFLKLGLVGVMMLGVLRDRRYEFRLPLLPKLDLVLRADELAMLFVSLSAVLWLFTTIYAIAYLEGSPNRSRFFGFFSLCVSATIGIALAGNLFTFLIFYETLTLATYPLVVHRGTPAALHAGRVYLRYTMGGGAMLLIGVVWLHTLAGTSDFGVEGLLANLGAARHPSLIAVFVLLIAGLSVKAALAPLHGWLPIAMVAPAPVSALLHAVAVVKAGAFGIVRVVYDVYGVHFSESLGVTAPLALLAAVTIIYGSIRALLQDDLKRRLAFSTISQVSYIMLGIAVVGASSTVGGVVHLVHQGLMKITLFFCAGNIAETLGVHRISKMNGVARRMPWTMSAFTLGAFGMIGVPPLAGFISKWHLGVGALEAQQSWVIAVLALSSLLNAAYFLPILYTAWFKPPLAPWPHDHHGGRFETRLGLLLPPLATAFLALAVGLFAAAPFSPLTWAKLIVEREYRSVTPPGSSVIETLLTGHLPWLLAPGLPLLAALALAWPALRPAALAAAPWTALPALALALWTPPDTLANLPWLLLGSRLGLDETGVVFLFLSAALWTVAGLYARSYLAHDEARPRFFVYFLLTMAGNLGLILAHDAASFYLFFALMSFASYGLILHKGDDEARWAGKVYIILVAAGEILLFVGILFAVHAADGVSFERVNAALTQSHSPLVLGCLLAGFGIKVGALPLHVWLPLAHPVAPTPASAVLSGVLIKAGLLGWMRFLPLGAAALPDWGALCLVVGLGGAFFGVLAGMVQSNAKAALAYSSISQMGMMTVGIGAALIDPECWPLVRAGLWIYVLHHALAKGALFLGVGVAAHAGRGIGRRGLILAGLLLPALALAGVPLTSGAVAKTALKSALQLPSPWFELVPQLLSLAAVGTTLLMARFLYLVWPTRKDSAPPPLGIWLPWLMLLLAVAWTVFLWPWQPFPLLGRQSIAPAYLWPNAWPALAGAGLALLIWLGARWTGRGLPFLLPAGDLALAVGWLLGRLHGRSSLDPVRALFQRRPDAASLPILLWQRLRLADLMGRLEARLHHWPLAGLLFLSIAALVLAFLTLP